jgi:NAD(P)-dependent dehydrogenase (short-subunit alcohol dehydrogenase family)
VMTLALLAAGASVAATELDAEALDETGQAAEASGAGERILDVVADVTRDDSAPRIARAATERFGRLDILLNNAGINMTLFRRPDLKLNGKFWDVTPEEFRRIIDVNVIAAFLMSRAALAVMLKQHWGRIINVTTSLDTMYRGGMQPYGGSKAANEAHLLGFAQELEGTGVTANVLVPGGAANTRMVSVGQQPDRAKLVSPDVMVAPLIWLCSNASDGVNGQRFIGAQWDKSLPPNEAAKKAGAPAAWQQLGRQAITPDSVR